MAQVRDHMIYQGGEVLLLRAAARSLDSAFVPWPDPADGEELRMWLVKAWEDPVLREAVACASPSLAARADRIAASVAVPARQVLSAAVALARYQLRAAGRPTPFGLFAGVAGARFGATALVRFGKAHQAAARCDAAWLLSVIERCESCAPLAGHLTVVLSSLAGRRPYDLRHAAVSLWLNSGVPATEVARRAGHGVAVLLKIYAHCIDGQADAANRRITDALGTQDAEPGPAGEADDSEQAS